MTSPTPSEERDGLVDGLLARKKRFQANHGNYLYYYGADAILDTHAAAEITRLRAENEQIREAAKVFEDHYERGICHHESTHRGGSIWTICDDCGAQWADDEGGFQAFEYPTEIVAARAARRLIK